MTRRWFHLFFALSGFCSLTYEVVWLRLAMAQFGVNTPLVAIVLSAFMGGIALGSIGGGWLAARLTDREGRQALRLYALAELLIAVGCLAVPSLFQLGHHALNQGSAGAVWGSGAYYFGSGLAVAITLLPFTTCMGATMPLAMPAVAARLGTDVKAFSLLYASNVFGAAAGAATAAFVLIELLGLRRTTFVAGALNVVVAVLAFGLSRQRVAAAVASDGQPTSPREVRRPDQDLSRDGYPLLLLFLIGLMSLGMEVVWTRQFTPYLGTVVYAFSGTLTLYLGATFIGSSLYRWWARTTTSRDIASMVPVALVAVGLAGLLPIIVSDPRLPVSVSRVWGLVRVFFGVVPFCMVVGFLSPLLVDAWSRGEPGRAGRAYALNTVGCIVGPILASFAVLSWASERWAILIFLAPPVLVGLLGRSWFNAADARKTPAAARFGSAAALALVVLIVVMWSEDPEALYPERTVRRDYTATVVAATVDDQKHLFVNGQGMVYLTPVTKMMAHLPLALRKTPAQKGLVICFGMGTSLRSMHSWGISATGVELVPSVPQLMGYFHHDGPTLLQSPLIEVVIDDGRRFLERTRDRYDVITVDPPPPVEAAGSSLLYSTEWYALIKQRLQPDGILQQWLPYADLATFSAVSRAIQESFPYVRVFNSFEGWGFHYIASMTPFDVPSASELAERLPPDAVRDLVEMGPAPTATAQFASVLSREVPLRYLIDALPGTPALTDDLPVNEYFLWRRTLRDGWSIYFSNQSGTFNSRRIAVAAE